MKKFSIYGICTLWMIVDQLIKKVITSTFSVGEKISIISNFFDLHYLQNEGAAFSSFAGMRVLFILIAIIFFFLIADFIKKNEINSNLEVISLGIILGGLLGNLIDRMIYGYVIDYLSFTIMNYSFAVFNFADIGIVVGVGILCLLFIRRGKYERD